MNNKRIKKVVILFTAICVIADIIHITYNFLFPLYLTYKMNIDLRGASAIGIIGGADGPTTILVASSQSSSLIAVILTLLSIIGVVYLIITKRKKDNKGIDIK